MKHMENTIKNTITLIVGLVITLVIASSCGSTNQDIINKTTAALEQKYDDTFKFIRAYSANAGASEALFSCESIPNAEIVVRRKVNADKAITYLDNYLAHTFQNQIEKEVLSIATNIYGECKVLYSVGSLVLSENMTSKTSFTEYISTYGHITTLDIILSESADMSEKDVDIEKFRQALTSNKLSFDLNIYYSDSKAFPDLNKETINKKLNDGMKWCLGVGYFMMDSAGEFTYTEWR